MRRIVKFLVLSVLTYTAQAQTESKIGYLNPQNILADLPEVKAAMSELEAFSLKIMEKDSLMVIAFQEKARILAEKQQKGELAPVQLDQERAKLEAEQVKIQEFEQSLQQDIDKKRQELLKPLYNRVNEAINEIAKENGFTYVIDVSSGSLLYADEAYNLLNLVRKKMGLPEAAAKE